MWLIFIRESRPDARVWPGRRALAVADAVGWPCVWALGVLSLPAHGGLFGHCALVFCAAEAMRRVHRAVVVNHRYHFTTWRWGRRLVLVLALGYGLKLAALLTGSPIRLILPFTSWSSGAMPLLIERQR